MITGSLRVLLLSCGILLGYAVLMASQPTRVSFRDGWRCVVRYKTLITIPLFFAGCHAIFGLWVRFDEARTIPGAPPFLTPWNGWHPSLWQEVLSVSLLPAAEGVASIFNCAVTTFPLSALWGLLFLFNWRGYRTIIGRGLRRRLGSLVGSLAQAGLGVCALAACAKPVFFGKFPWLSTLADERTLLQLGEGINWLSFLFEYLVGVGVQIYLLLLAFAWVRGLTFDSRRLGLFTLRRWILVSKWAGLLLLVSSLGINLPLLLANVSYLPGPGGEMVMRTVISTRWFLAIGLAAFCTVQIFLVFHNGTLLQAFTDHFRFVRRHAMYLAWFGVVALIHSLILAVFNVALPRALGDWTWPALCWKVLLYPLLWAGLSAWLLASWVCLFRRCAAGKPEADDLLTY